MEWPSARDRLREDRPRERAEHGDRRDPPGSDVDPDVVLATRDDAQTWDRRRASSSPRTTRRGRASRLARRRRRARDFIFQGRRRPGVAYARRRTTRRAVRRVRDVPRRRGGELPRVTVLASRRAGDRGPKVANEGAGLTVADERADLAVGIRLTHGVTFLHCFGMGPQVR